MNNEETAKINELKSAIYKPALVVNVMPPSEVDWFREYARNEFVVADGNGNVNGRDSGHFGFALAHIFKEFREYQEIKLILIDQAGREPVVTEQPQQEVEKKIKTLAGNVLNTRK